MPVAKKETREKVRPRGIVSDNVRSHANDPFFIKKNEEAREGMKTIRGEEK